MATGLVDRTIATARGARRLAFGAYHRLARVNYDREWVARQNRTPAGTFRCYEPLNRHGRDSMLAAVSAVAGPEDVIYDVGANVGIYALALVSEATGRRVVAFEPAPKTRDRLRANVALNGLGDRIDVLPYGLGDSSGDRPFFVSTNPELSAFERESAERWGATVREPITVPVCRIDELVDRSGVERDYATDHRGRLPPPDVLKIDAEGTAPAVLRGARETLDRHRPTVVVEVHDVVLERDGHDALLEPFEDLPYSVRVDDTGGFLVCDAR